MAVLEVKFKIETFEITGGVVSVGGGTYVPVYSYAPMSYSAVPLSSPSMGRGFPSLSVVTSVKRAPLSIAAEPCWI